MRKYIRTPYSISWQEIANKGFSLSSSQYEKFIIPNANFRYVRDFMERPLCREDLGYEVGTLSYIDKSPFSFIRAKALQESSFLLDINKETSLPILPREFVQMNLKEGDLLISKDSNIGEIAILERDYPNSMVSGAIYKLPVKAEWRFYLLAFIKHGVFREQLDSLVPKGATIRHAKTMFLDCKIPLPKNDTEKAVLYITLLTRAIVEKEKLIKQRHENILGLIEQELFENQTNRHFHFQMPTLQEINETGRLDSNLYSGYLKKEVFFIKNYYRGYKTIEQLGFTLSRGQNLQITNIGKSVYSKVYHKNFYTLVLPKFLSKYGTINETCYLGNPNDLKTLRIGDLIFGAEGFEKGRSIVVIEEKSRTITNIHGITLQQEDQDLSKAIFIKCFMDYLRNKGLIDLFAVGGNGGSLAQKYWGVIPFPDFPQNVKDSITKLYYNSKEESSALTASNFREKDALFNREAGVYELDKSAKRLKIILSQALDCIANNKDISYTFN